jgi:hypothetical protein
MAKALISWGWIQESEIRDRRQIGLGIAAAIEQAIEDDPIVGYYGRARRKDHRPSERVEIAPCILTLNLAWRAPVTTSWTPSPTFETWL